MLLLLALTLAAAATGCAKKDTSPPPAPILDPLPATTELDHLTLLGTAQYGATIAVTRTPGLGAALPAIVADPYTAHFQTDLPLEIGDNSFSVTAANANGAGAASTFKVTRAAAHPHTVALRLDVAEVDADKGVLVARAHVTLPGSVPLAGYVIDFAAALDGSTGTGGADGGTGSGGLFKATTDEAGDAVATLTGLSEAGAYTLTATSELLATAKDTARFVVRGGAPFSIALTVTGGGFNRTTATSVPAGTQFTVGYKVKDAEGNALGVGVQVQTDYPGLLQGNTLQLDQAGSYKLQATVDGTQLVDAVAFTVTAGAPKHLSVSFPKATVASGEAIVATVVVTDAQANVIPGAGYAYTVTKPAGATAPVATGDSFVFAQAGSYTVAASDLLDTTVTGSAALQVSPSAPSALALTLTPQTVTPGSPVAYTTVVTDAAGNVVTGAPLQIFTDAPGAVAAGGQVSGLTRAGVWHVTAQVQGTGVSDTKPFTVTTGTATSVKLSLGAFNTITGNAVPYTAVVSDAAGNAIAGATVQLTSNATSGFTADTTAKTVAFAVPGAFIVTATALNASGQPILDGAGNAVTDRASLNVAFPADAIAPTNVVITSPVGAAQFAPNQTINITVTAQDDVGLETLRVQVRGANGTVSCDISYLQPAATLCLGTAGCAAPAASFVCQVPGSASAGQVSIVAAATDTSGNTTLSAVVTVRVDLSGLLNLPTGVTGITVASNGLLDRPTGIVELGGQLYVANNGGSANLIKIDPATGTQSQFTGAIGTGSPWDLASDGTNLYATVNNGFGNNGGRQLLRFNGGGGSSTFVDTTACATRARFQGLFVDQNILPGLLLATDTQNSSVGEWSLAAPVACPTTVSRDTWNGDLQTPFGVAARATPTANVVEIFGGNNQNDNHIWRRTFNLSTNTWSNSTYSNNAISDDVSGSNQGQCNGQSGSFPSCQPAFIKFGQSGKLYASNLGGSAVTSYTLPAAQATSCGTQGCVDPTLVVDNLNTPAGICLPASAPDHMYVVDRGRNAVFLLTNTGGSW
jgi:hypothetical protein